MSFYSRLKETWLRFIKKPGDGDLNEEIREHLLIEIDQNIDEGMTPEEARYAAHRKFGNVTLYKELAEEVWRFAWLESVIMDIRHAYRGFCSAPGFAVTVIGTLALGLGALAASYSVFDTVVLRQYAVRDPKSLYAFLNWRTSRGENESEKWSFTLREFNAFRLDNPAFSEVVGYQNGLVSVAGKRANIQAVTGNYFAMLGGRICMGRPLMERDDGPGEGVAVASYRVWKGRLGADPGIVGKRILFNKRPIKIVGVACPEFTGPQIQKIDFWSSLAVSRELVGDIGVRGYGAYWRAGDFPQLMVMGRLKESVTREGAEAALLAYGRQQYLTWRNWSRPPESAKIEQRATMFPLDRASVAFFTPWILAFGLLLLIACANVSNIILARGLARRREIGIRISLGAGRKRMVRQFLTESLMLAIPASLAAFVTANLIIRVSYWLLMNVIPAFLRDYALADFNIPDFSPRLHVLAFLLATAFLTPLVFGLLPAIQTTRSRLAPLNRGELENDRHSTRLRATLVVTQAAFCTLLLILSIVAMRNGIHAAALDLGLDTNGVFSIELSDKAKLQSVLYRISSLAGTESVGTCVFPPLKYADPHPRLVAEDGTVDTASAIAFVSPEYFDVYKLAVRGRKSSAKTIDFRNSFIAPDGAEVVLSETAAHRLWPSGNALGRTLEEKRWDKASNAMITSRYSVVGIARDSVYELRTLSGALNPNRAVVYFLGASIQKEASFPTIVVRMKPNPDGGYTLLQKTLEEILPGASHYKISSALEEWEIQLYPYRALAAIAGFLGAMALLMTTSGVFGVLSYIVAQRRKDFSIRVALGAGKLRMACAVLRQSMGLAATGSLLGALISFAAARVMASSFMLFDAGGYILGVSIVIAAAFAASWSPARRAINHDPAGTLHCD